MVRILTRRLAVAGTLLALTQLAEAANQLRQAQFTAASSDSAQLTLSLSAVTKPTVFALDSPARLVIDLPATKLAGGARLPKAAGPVRSLRSGMQDRTTLRLVLELSRELTPTVHTVCTKLVIDLGEPRVTASVSPSEPTAVRASHAPADY